jgi:hypothetical protein
MNVGSRQEHRTFLSVNEFHYLTGAVEKVRNCGFSRSQDTGYWA